MAIAPDTQIAYRCDERRRAQRRPLGADRPRTIKRRESHGTCQRTAATGGRYRSRASERRTAEGVRLSTPRMGEMPSPLALQLLMAWRRVSLQPESVCRQGEYR